MYLARSKCLFMPLELPASTIGLACVLAHPLYTCTYPTVISLHSAWWYSESIASTEVLGWMDWQYAGLVTLPPHIEVTHEGEQLFLCLQGTDLPPLPPQPHRSGQGLVLFNIFINYLEKGVHREISEVADDKKLFQVVKSQTDGKEIQKDPTKLSSKKIGI